MADYGHRASRDDTECNFGKTKCPFLRKRNHRLAEGFPSCSVGAALPGGGDVNPPVPTAVRRLTCKRAASFSVAPKRGIVPEFASARGLLHHSGAPAPVHETLPRSKQGFIGHKPDDDNHQHDSDHLVPGTELT